MHTRSFARIALFSLPLAVALAAPAYAQEPAADDPLAVGTADPAAVEAFDPAAAGDVEMTVDEVQSYQQTLKELGYFFGPADGRKGPRTRTALRNFQRDVGLEATGSFDPETLARIDDQARVARVSAPASRDSRPEPVAAVAAPRGGDSVAARIGGGLKTGVGAAGKGVVAAGKGVGTAGAAAGKGVGAAGEATADAGVAAGKGVAAAGIAVKDASVYVARKTAEGSTGLYGRTKRLFVGDDRTSDEQIRRAILAQYADDDRVVASEVDLQVYDGNVTVALPEGARTDAPHAARLARLVPGVRSVTTIYVEVVPENADPAGR